MKPFFSRDRITIYNARCEQVLPFIDPVDLVLTDPPYGIAVNKNQRPNTKPKNGKAIMKDYGVIAWDEKPPTWLLQQVISVGSRAIIWGGNHFSGLEPSQCWLVWDKDNGDNKYADCELAWTNLAKAVRRFRWKWHGMLQEQMGPKKEYRWHPTQKPVALMNWCISLADACSVVDPFMGVGSTLVAAKAAGICAIGIEVSEEYCEQAAKRLEQNVLDFGERDPESLIANFMSNQFTEE